MKDLIDLVFIIGILIAGLLIGTRIGFNMYEKEVIERGFAQHNPVSGDFEWKEGK